MRLMNTLSLTLSLSTAAMLSFPAHATEEPAKALAAETAAPAPASKESLGELLTPEKFDADAAIAALESSDMSSRKKISGKAMIDSARNIPANQLGTALEQIRVVLELE